MRIYNPKLTEEELGWFELILANPCKYRDLMIRQIENAQFVRDYSNSYLILKLINSPDMERLPRLPRAAINMLVQHNSTLDPDRNIVCYQDRYSMVCIEGDNGEVPTEFILHIYDGFVQELEIYNLDSSFIDRNQICHGRADYSLSHMLDPNYDSDDALPCSEFAISAAHKIYLELSGEVTKKEVVSINANYDEEKAAWVVSFSPHDKERKGSICISLRKKDGKLLGIEGQTNY